MDIGKLREKGELELVDNRYYNGFEGEREIQFVYKKDNDTDIFIIWEGYFDQIMRLVKPDENGWNGMAYCIICIPVGMKKVHGILKIYI